MRSYEIDIQIEPPFSTQVDEAWLGQVAAHALEAENQPEGTGLALVITDDEHIQALNRVYRDSDSPTDVLSFSAREGEEFVMPAGQALYLGDVIISFPRALAQASEQGQSATRELALLIVHGCLHLLGYDHDSDAEEARMWARQDEILKSL